MLSRLFRLALIGIALCVGTAKASPLVRIESGEITGSTSGAVDAFKGIPYAAPPIGDLRWRPPERVRPWRDPLSATDYGHSCPQHSPLARVDPSSKGATASEDCLTLNVWTPTQRPTKLMPVMVWIHGGGNNSGTSAQTYYDGSAFARDGVVLVSLNYRLGALGFLTHPALTGANFGLLDQLAALKWVQRNIKTLGGDPHNVTVFGESAGGTDILLLMTAQKAAGTFQKAIVESAGWWNHAPDLSAAQKSGAEIATQLGLRGVAATAAQLRALPVDVLSNIGDPGPVIDHELLSESPQSAFEHGRARAIPLIIGTNSNEGSLLPDDAPATDVDSELSSADLDTLKSLYRADRETSHPPGIPGASSDRAGDIREPPFAPLLFRDAHFSMPARWIAAREAKSASAFLYRFDYVASFLRRQRTSANHGSEIPFVFATWPDFRLNETDQHLTRTLHGCWVAFAKTGEPACPDAPPWPSFSVGSDIWMRFGESVAPQPVSDREVLNFLQSRLQK